MLSRSHHIGELGRTRARPCSKPVGDYGPTGASGLRRFGCVVGRRLPGRRRSWLTRPSTVMAAVLRMA